MRDIWNPWHGCKKISEGCKNCYMYFLDNKRGLNGAEIYKVKNNFDYPLQTDRFGNYKVRSGEFIKLCMTSDFFLEEADQWRPEVWDIIRKRSDVVFIIVTKRPNRILQCLPTDWNDGWENIWLNITVENQKRADERLPILLDLPFQHKGILVAPFISPISVSKYLQTKQIENVWCGGENYAGARPLYLEWVQHLSQECKTHNVTFSFLETGNVFVKNGTIIKQFNKTEQKLTAFSEHLNYKSSIPQTFKLTNPPQTNLFDLEPERTFKENCSFCSMKKYCSGCSNCGKCAK